MHPSLQVVADTLPGVKLNSGLVTMARTTAEAFKDMDYPAIRSLAHKLFGQELPQPITPNPRKEGEMQVRYVIQDMVKQAQKTDFLQIDPVAAFNNGCDEAVAFITRKENTFVLINRDGSASENEITGEKIEVKRKSGYVKGTGKTGRVKGEVGIKAKAVFDASPNKENAHLVQLFIKEVGMSDAGARTYAFNFRKAAGLTGTKKAKKA